MITYLIRTNSLNSDERFEKTLSFLVKCGQEVEVFGVVKRLSNSGGSFIERELLSRKRLPSGKFVFVKYLEMLAIASWYLLRSRGRRWFANFDFLPLHFLSAMLATRNSRPIWDLHEMPPQFVESIPILRRMFAYLLKRSDIIICNDARRLALEDAFGVQLDAGLVLRNYPSRDACLALVSERTKYLSSTAPKDDALNILIVGGNVPGRFVSQSVEAIDELRRVTGLDIQVTLVGGPPLETAHNFVASTGFIPFEQLISDCVKGGVSLCFYALDSPNNVFCEPNRFYQGLMAGQDVLTFMHPSLEHIVSGQRHIVDQNHFSTSFQETLRGLLVERLSIDRHLRAAPNLIDCDFVFEDQLSAFSDWLGAG